MNGQEAVDLMKLRLARFGSSTTRDDDYLFELNQAQKRLELNPFLPWFLLSESSTINTVKNETRIIVPVDMLREYEEGALYVLDSEGTEHEITKGSWGDIKDDPRFATPAIPTRYATVGKYFRLRPEPNDIYTVRMIFYQEQATLVVGSENNWLKYASDLLIAEAGWIIASSYLQNAKSQKMFEDMIVRENNRLFVADEARKHANHVYVGED